MILRRVIEHVKAQNWTAVALDFFIVVIGVFVGLQVNNWNEARAAAERETELLEALQSEIESAIFITDQKSNAISQVVAAGRRSLAFIERGDACRNDCWPVLVDFYHASQWQPIDVTRTTYDEMRRQGLPRSREIIDAVEGFLAQNNNLSATHFVPAYRSLVRQMIHVDAQAYYWLNCYQLENGAEYYVLDCPGGVSEEIARQSIENILQNPQIEPNLTEWIGIMSSTPPDLGVQNEAAKRAIAAIDTELERRK